MDAFRHAVKGKWQAKNDTKRTNTDNENHSMKVVCMQRYLKSSAVKSF